MPKSKQKSTREKGRFLARMRLEQMGYRVLPSDERGIAFYVFTGEGLEPVKVKTIRYGSWQFAADKLMDITVSKDGVQTIHSRKPQADEDMLCIMVRLDEQEFYVPRLGQLYDVVCTRYETWLAEHGGRRPRKPKSMHCSATPEDLADYRDNWQLFKPVGKVAFAPYEPSSLIGTVRHILHKFCLEFIEHPYLCYTEHGLHALLYARLYNALWEDERFADHERRKVCVLQKEYPTAHDLGKPKRQHWDLAVIQTPLESTAEGDQPAYDYLRLAAAVEVGLNEPEEHLREDIRRLYHEKANIDHGFVLHLHRLSKPGALISSRDWSYNSPRILSVERAKDILEEQASEAAAEREVEILYAVTGETGEHEAGVWLIRKGGVTRLA
jgi:hypothetical protein